MNNSGGSKGAVSTGQMLVDRGPVFDNGYKSRKVVHSRKGVMRPTKKHRKPRFL